MTESCKLGCEKEINFQEIVFSDKVRIRIPKDGDQLHICKKVKHFEYVGGFDDDFRDDEYLQFDFDDNDKSAKHMAIIRDYLVYNLFTNMPQVSLEHYRDRQFLKQLFGMALYEHPYLFSYPLFNGVGGPADCNFMINQSSLIEGVFDGELKMAILGILGSLYQMDGQKDDAIKCFEIMNELDNHFEKRLEYLKSSDYDEPMMPEYGAGGMSGYSDEFEPADFTAYYQKFIAEDASVQVKEISNDKKTKDIKKKLENFEMTVIRDFIRQNFSQDEIHEYMINKKPYPKSNETLHDKVKRNREQSAESLVQNAGPDDDIEYIDLKDNISMIESFFYKYHAYEKKMYRGGTRDNLPDNLFEIIRNCQRIIRFRNNSAHPKTYNPKQYESEMKVIDAMIDQVTIHLEEYRRD